MLKENTARLNNDLKQIEDFNYALEQLKKYKDNNRIENWLSLIGEYDKLYKTLCVVVELGLLKYYARKRKAQSQIKEFIKDYTQIVCLVQVADVSKDKEICTEKTQKSDFEELKNICEIVYKACEEMNVNKKFGVTMLVYLLRGSKSKKIVGLGLNESNFYGRLSYLSSEQLFVILEFLIHEKFILRTDGQYPTISVGDFDILNKIDYAQLEKAINAKPIQKTEKDFKVIVVDGYPVLVDAEGIVLTDVKLFHLLRVVRNQIANEKKIK